MRVTRNLWIAAAGLVWGSWIFTAHAAPDAPNKPGPAASGQASGENLGPEEHARRTAAALSALRGSDPAAIGEALGNLKELRGRAAAEGIVARLKSGLPPQLIESAIDALGALQQPLAAPVLAELTLHKRWLIRQRAVEALSSLRVRSTISVLLYALDDPSPEVRSAAARGLGMVGDPRARKALEAALERGVQGALEGLAQLATSAQVDGILAHAKPNLSAAEPALWALLARPNLPPVTKLKVIQFVRTHDSEQEAEQLLMRFRERAKSEGDARLLPALSQTPSPAPSSTAKPQAATGAAVHGLAQRPASTSEGAKP